MSDDVNAPIVSQARHRRHLEDCRESLDVFLRESRLSSPPYERSAE